MSGIIDGKISNQPVISYTNEVSKVNCGCCSREIDKPKFCTLKLSKKLDREEEVFSMLEYIRKPYYIYETKSGHAVCYCSDKCRRKHNHRFTKRG